MSLPIKILVVDDSVVIRKILEKILSGHADLQIAGIAKNGQEAVNKLSDKNFVADLNIIILDIEMPVMDGITALPKIHSLAPNARVIIASTLSQKGAEVSLKALELGATDYLPKPSAEESAGNFEIFSHELLEKVRIHGKISQNRIKNFTPSPAIKTLPQATQEEKITLTKPPIFFKPEAIAIGSSTGGPDALKKVLSGLGVEIIKKYPVFITQHMPPHFTTMLAQNLSKNTNHDCIEIEDGMQVEAGKIYIARGDFHMEVEKTATGKIIHATKIPPENFCRPAVDVMLRSLINIYKEKLLVTILTGMGSDGLKGSQLVVQNGGVVIAQDKNSSVVWGMPGAVAMAGVCSHVLPLDDVPRKILEMCR